MSTLSRLLGAALFFFVLFSTSSQLCSGAGVASKPQYRLSNLPPDDCELKKFNYLKEWEVAPLQEVIARDLEVLKEYSSSGTLMFQLEGSWYAIKKKCVDQIGAPRSPLELSGFVFENNTSIFINLAYRNLHTDAVGANAKTLPIDEAWKGIVIGLQRHLFVNGLFERHFGVDLEAGSSSVTGQSTILSYAMKAFGGIGWAVSEKTLVLVETGLLLRYGKFQTPLDSLTPEVPFGLVEEVRIAPKRALRFNENVFLKTNSYAFGAGLAFDI